MAVDINRIRERQQLLFYEANELSVMEREGEKPGEREGEKPQTAVLGKVVSIDPQKDVIVLRIGNVLRAFSSRQLLLLPREQGTPVNASTDATTRKLMGFIVEIAEGKVTPRSLHEVANKFNKLGVMPTAPQELLEIL